MFPASIVYAEIVGGGLSVGNFSFADPFADSLSFILEAGQSTGEITLAIFTMRQNFTGPFPTTQTIRFSIGVNSQTTLLTQHFSVTATAVPEPTTMILFSTGLAVLVARQRRRRRAG
jgi:hypothetical protein